MTGTTLEVGPAERVFVVTDSDTLGTAVMTGAVQEVVGKGERVTISSVEEAGWQSPQTTVELAAASMEKRAVRCVSEIQMSYKHTRIQLEYSPEMAAAK